MSYLDEQVVTYLGNKRSLLSFIEEGVSEVQRQLGKSDISVLDLFSGSGVVSRYFKTFAGELYVNDLEGYSNRLNHCYLMNSDEFDKDKLEYYFNDLVSNLGDDKLVSGFITDLYAPKDDNDIQDGERVFYTNRNAKYIDTARQLIESVPEPYKTLLLAPLLYEASNKNNTSGVFKGFYKNSETNRGQFGGNGRNGLHRILANIELKLPILCDRDCEYHIYQKDANELVKELPVVDLAYLDPPYKQHPYGSNYFMLNLINEYKKPSEISKVAGIPVDWNKSVYNKKALALSSFTQLCKDLKARYILISFNSEGFITYDDMVDMLSKIGEVKVFEQNYNTFKASRNLSGRDLYVKEYLYLVKKDII